MSRNNINCTVKMDGVVEKLVEFGPKLVRKSIRTALRSAGQIWVDEMKSKAPVDSGGLRDSIGMKVQTRMVKDKEHGMKTPVGKVTVGPKMVPRKDDKNSVGPGVYGMWVELGLKLKKYTFTPFVRPTFDGSVERVQQVFADKLKEGFDSMGKED